MKTTTTAIAKALVYARDTGGMSEVELESIVQILNDSAMAIEVDFTESDGKTSLKKTSELLGELAVEIDDLM